MCLRQTGSSLEADGFEEGDEVGDGKLWMRQDLRLLRSNGVWGACLKRKKRAQ